MRRRRKRAGVRAAVAALAATVAVGAPSIGSASEVFISPGIKLAYTFGQGGGFTWGAEVSVLRMTDGARAALAQGAVLNLTWVYQKAFHARLGYEVISWVAGAEAGPALVWDARGAHLAFGVTPWLGFIFVVPYYTQTFVSGPDLKELGVYGKLPICVNCPNTGSDGSRHDWD